MKTFVFLHFSFVPRKSWSLFWEWSSFTSVVSGAPSASFAESGTSAFPGLGALLGTLPVVGFSNGAVLVVRMSFDVGFPVVFPDTLGVIEIFSGGWDKLVTESNWVVVLWVSWDHEVLEVMWVVVVVSSFNSDEQSNNCSEFHF
jgi:hypothetical protein